MSQEFSLCGFTLPGYKLFQYGSSLLGLPLLAAWVLAYLVRATPLRPVGLYPFSLRATGILWCVLLLTPCVIAAFVLPLEATIYQKVGRTIRLSGLTSISLLVIGAVVFQAIAGHRFRFASRAGR